MITILSVICCILAACIIYSSGVGAVGMSALIQEDLYSCPADYLPVQSGGRRIILVNDICRVVAAGVMLIFGVNLVSRAGQTFFFASPVGLAAAVALLCLASLGSMLVCSINKYGQIRDGISTQWKKEKRISARHDDEVRLYRILGEVAGIPGINARMVVYIGVLYVLSILAC